ncbi:MAG: glucoamylase family protein, partial [Gemmatimonadaceae bacterium]
MTIDADTVLPPDAAALLVGTIAHPLNRAVYDPVRGRVGRGYGIIQPRVGVALPSAFRSRFATVHSGHPGVDPYTTAVSDVYQDLYGEGSFTGKGAYDIDAFERATRGRFPENTLLSHDLIEGNYARAGLATDIQVFDEYPTRYLTYTRRMHRWIRGDWQLLPWLAPRVPGPEGLEPNRLSLLSRWKIFDNVRRSTVEIAQLLFLVAGLTILPGFAPRWTVVALAIVAAPWAISLLLALLRPPLDKSWRAYYATVWDDARTSATQVALAVTFLPHQALVSADAIARTLWRLAVSRRNLLEWQTASQAERLAFRSARSTWRAMWPAAATGGVVLLAAAAAPDGGWRLVASVPIAAFWLAAPWIAHALGAPTVRRELELTDARRAQAMRYALLHWRYFERFVTAETQWLAPDNYQEDPSPVVAMRTSPTNIGLQLLATVSACDLGFIAAPEMAERLERVFRTLERMKRFRGHFYNWYDLRDLSVLEPAYVSTVDSGNLAGHLIAIRQACLSIAAEAPAGSELVARLETLADRAYRYAMEMDFRFLFDAERELFAIGYQQSTHALDTSHYDLLASEARLASLLAIAKRDVPPDHWFRLSRTLTRAAGETALVSWSGSMFEYLMPLLVTQSFPGTVLDQTYQGAVRRHMGHGAEHGVPWGVSESAYNVRDRHLTYQYRAFGVPDLALKRGLGQDLVVAPYASALAAMVDPEHALANLAEIEKLDTLGPMGFRDAIDYTRPAPGNRHAVVRTVMAHHVGMSLVALANVLRARLWQRRFHADPLVRSAELLLHERIPRRLLFQPAQAATVEEALPDLELERPAVREVDTPGTPQPVVALLGHLPYTLMVTNSGSGYSRYEELAVTRWRADGTRDATGQFCYIKDVARGRVWSVAHQPVCAPADWYRALLATDRVTFIRVDGDIETRTEIVAVPADAAEVRRVTLTNNGREPRELELTSYGEVVLAPPNTDRAHPAFANLFVETEYHEWCTAVTVTRRPRAATERRLWLVHVVATGPERVGPVTHETDRARFVGRGRTVAAPAALERDGPLEGTTGAVLDPIVALRTRVRLEPGQSASVTFTTLVATTPEPAFELADRYDDPHAAERALDLAWTAAQIELRELDVNPADAAVYQELAGHLFYRHSALCAPHSDLQRNRGSQPLLWAHGISGDWPILLATIDSAEGLPTLRQLLVAHHYWRRRGMTVDLVILDSNPSTYQAAVHERITAAVLASSEAGLIDRSGGVFVRRRDHLTEESLLMLRATARVHIACDGRRLGLHLTAAEAREAATQEANEWDVPPQMPYRLASRVTPKAIRVLRRLRSLANAMPHRAFDDRAAPGPAARAATPTDRAPSSLASAADDALLLDNGLGGLTREGDYEIRLRDGRLPPAPWANVIANARGGFLVTERGGCC